MTSARTGARAMESRSALSIHPTCGVTLEALMEMDEDELAISPWPFLTTRRVRDFVRKWGVNHPKVRARVFGEFPRRPITRRFRWQWLERSALPIDDDAMPPKNVAGLIQVVSTLPGQVMITPSWWRASA